MLLIDVSVQIQCIFFARNSHDVTLSWKVYLLSLLFQSAVFNVKTAGNCKLQFRNFRSFLASYAGLEEKGGLLQLARACA